MVTGQSRVRRWGRRALAVVLSVVALGTAGLLATTATAGDLRRSGRLGPDGGALFPAVLRGVALTEAQQEQVRQIVASHRPQFRRLSDALREARRTVNARLYGVDPVSAGDLAPVLDQVDHLRRELTQESVQVVLEIRGILTPEQLARASRIRERLHELQAEMDTLLGHR